MSVGAGCPKTNLYTWCLQSASYSVMVPDVTMIRLWPGCVCQPVLPPGCQTLLCTYRVDGPIVFYIDSQPWPGNPAGSGAFGERLKTSIGSNCPGAMVEAVDRFET